MRACLVKLYKYKILTYLCWVAFACQLFTIGYNLFYPSQKTTEIQKTELGLFPLVFKICPKPAFNISAVRSEGYQDVWNYFLGISLYNKSVFGWAGHANTSGGNKNKGVGQVYQDIVLYRNIEDIVDR